MFGIRVCLLLIISLLDRLLAVHGLRAFQEAWAKKCRESGFLGYNSTIDYVRDVEYRQCVGSAFNVTKFEGELEAIMKDINSGKPDYSTIHATLQKYCAPAKAYIKCSEKLSTECFTEEEMSRWNFDITMDNTVIDFFCDNDTIAMTEFINGNGFECYSARNASIEMCLSEFKKHMMIAPFVNGRDLLALFYGIIKVDMLCDLTLTAGNCILESFQSCERSTEPARLIANWIDYVEMGTKCSTQPKVNSSERIKQSYQFLRFQSFFGNVSN